MRPVPATQADTLPAAVPTVSAASEAGGLAHTRPKFPHRRALTEASWRAAHAWIETAYPGGLDAARPELTAKFPELAQNCDRLEQAAQQAASMFESEPTATPDAFQAALRAWEAATLDGLAALAHAKENAHA